jgi:hypothetical protein
VDLYAIMGEVAAAVNSITGLRVANWGDRSVSPPAALVTLPDRIEFDQTYRRGSDVMTDLCVVIIVGQGVHRTGLRQLAAYCAGSGSKSIKQAVEAAAYSAASMVTVTRCEFRPLDFAGTAYDIAATFYLTVVGPGG